MKEINRWRFLLRGKISLSWKNGVPKITILEKYEKKVKWTIRSLTLVGIMSSIITFSEWYFSLGFSILLLGIQQLFEKIIFMYTSIYVQPIPTFTYDKEEWKAMAYGISKDKRYPHMVGCAFATKEYANDFFQLLRSWNYGKTEDIDNNICLSFILEDENKYSVYLYPNSSRSIVSSFFKKVEEESKYEKKGKDHQQLIMQVTFCKVFPHSNKSLLQAFTTMQEEGEPFILRAFIYEGSGNLQVIEEIDPIIKYNYKYKYRGVLDSKDQEYSHGKYVMGK